MPDYEPAVILSACRTPIGSFGGSLKDLSAVDLGAIVIREAIRRADVSPVDLGDVIMGCVLQAGAGMNVARQAAIKAGVPQEVPSETVNRVCGSGLQSVVHAVEATRVGYTDLVLAGGTESMTNAPYILKGARWGFRMGHGEVYDSMLLEGLTCAMGGYHMGITAENIATRFNVTREQQDAYAAESQRRAESAIKGGLFKDEIRVANARGFDRVNDRLKSRAAHAQQSQSCSPSAPNSHAAEATRSINSSICGA